MQGVKEIGREAFSYCGKLTEIRLSDSISEIGSEAFGYCKGLTEVRLPQNEEYTVVSGKLFSECKELKPLIFQIM